MKAMGEILDGVSVNKSPTNIKTSLSDKPSLDSESATGLGLPDCPHCGGLGYIIPDVPPAHKQFGRAINCVCRNSENDKQVNRLTKLSEIGQLKDRTFDNFLVDVQGIPGFNAVTKNSLQTAYTAAHDFATHPEGWLILKGSYGCGKTHLAAAIANFQIGSGKAVLFVNTPDLLDYLRASYGDDAGMRFDERFELVRNARVLVLDDLGTQNNTSWAQEKLYQIFNYRYTEKLPTVITTNQDFEAIEPRIRSRLVDKNLTTIVEIFAPDFRRPKDQSFSDFSALHLHADKTFGTFAFRDEELPHSMSTNLKRAFEAALDYAKEPVGWIVFQSIAYGNGKTHLAASIANYLSDSGEHVLFVGVPDLLDYLRDAFDPMTHIGLAKRFAEIKKMPVLVLDDLGTESATPWAKEKLYQLMNYRYNARLPTIITSSQSINEIDARLKTRMMDGNICAFWNLEAPSFKGTKESNQEKKGFRKRSPKK
ncbi:MAG: ATP-binding protein [Anaerolineae bacterium]|nr:ATP-binding protein [Anaerolineae bacterium]